MLFHNKTLGFLILKLIFYLQLEKTALCVFRGRGIKKTQGDSQIKRKESRETEEIDFKFPVKRILNVHNGHHN